MYKLLIATCLLIFLFLLSPVTFAETIVIPFDKATIQEGIGAASDNDIIVVTPGLYVENIDFGGKTIRITTAEGPGETSLMPADPNQPTVTISNQEGEGTEFSGFDVYGGLNAHTVFISNGASPLISGNVFHDNILESKDGRYDKAVVACWDSLGMPVVEDNIFYNNGGFFCIWVFMGKTLVLNNTFDGNRAAIMCNSGLAQFKNNIIANSLGIAVDGVFGEMGYNLFFQNSTDYG